MKKKWINWKSRRAWIILGILRIFADAPKADSDTMICLVNICVYLHDIMMNMKSSVYIPVSS